MRDRFSSRWDRDGILERAEKRVRLGRNNQSMKSVLAQNTNLPDRIRMRIIHSRK